MGVGARGEGRGRREKGNWGGGEKKIEISVRMVLPWGRGVERRGEGGAGRAQRTGDERVRVRVGGEICMIARRGRG